MTWWVYNFLSRSDIYIHYLKIDNFTPNNFHPAFDEEGLGYQGVGMC